MENRVNTLQFDIDTEGPKVTSIAFQRWLRDVLACNVHDVKGIQQEFGTRRVFVKFATGTKSDWIMTTTAGKGRIQNEDSTETKVEISYCGFGYREIRIFNVPFEVKNEVISAALAPYGKVLNIRSSTYGDNYIFKCDSGVRIARMELKKHVPSFLYIGTSRTRATVVYDGQERTCAVCNKPGHLRFNCPSRKPAQERLRSWADIVNSEEDNHMEQDDENNSTSTEQPTAQDDNNNTEKTPPGGDVANLNDNGEDSAQPSGSAEKNDGARPDNAAEVGKPKATEAKRAPEGGIGCWQSGSSGVNQENLKEYSRKLLDKIKNKKTHTDTEMEFSSEEDQEGKGKKRPVEWEASKDEKRRQRKQERLKEIEKARTSSLT